MNMEKPKTPEEIVGIEKSRAISDVELLKGGAEYVVNEEERLDVTEKQKMNESILQSRAKQGNKEKKEKSKSELLEDFLNASETILSEIIEDIGSPDDLASSFLKQMRSDLDYQQVPGNTPLDYAWDCSRMMSFLVEVNRQLSQVRFVRRAFRNRGEKGLMDYDQDGSKQLLGSILQAEDIDRWENQYLGYRFPREKDTPKARIRNYLVSLREIVHKAEDILKI